MAFLVPEANRKGAFILIFATRIKPRAVGGPGDGTEAAIVHACRIGSEEELKVLGAVDLDGGRVFVPYRYPVAVRIDRHAERFFTAKRCPLPFKLEARPVAPQQAIIGDRIKPARCIERGTVAVLPTIIPVVPDKAPAGRFPDPQAFAIVKRVKRCRKVSAVGRPGEMQDHIVELETLDELSGRRIENKNPAIDVGSSPSPSSGGDELAIGRECHRVDLTLVARSNRHPQHAQELWRARALLGQCPQPCRFINRAGDHQAA